MEFKNLKLKPEIQQSLEEMGFVTASQIQHKSLPYALEGKDLIAQAQTGTGKTAAFAIPILEQNDDNLSEIQNIVIAPTRELASQIYNQISLMAKYTKTRVALILGGVSYEKQISNIKGKNVAHVIVATPGRLEDILSTRKLNLSHLKTFTLDEADELLKIGFLPEIKKIITYLPKYRQNFFFTATFDKKTKQLSEEITVNPVSVMISEGMTSSSKIKQEFVVMKESAKLNALIKFLYLHNPESAVIFGRTKRRVDELNEALNTLGFNAVGIQGDMQQRERTFAMDKFRNKKAKILIATDVIARGIDVEDVNIVINVDLPQEVEYYTHRIGRTGRAGKEGYSLSFVKPSEVEHIKKIAKETNSKIKEIEIPTDKEMSYVVEKKLNDKFENILSENTSSKYTSIQDKLILKYSEKELAIILADYISKENSLDSNIKLNPEPAVIIRNRENKNNSRNNGNRNRNDRGRSRDRNKDNNNSSNNKFRDRDRNRDNNKSRFTRSSKDNTIKV